MGRPVVCVTENINGRKEDFGWLFVRGYQTACIGL